MQHFVLIAIVAEFWGGLIHATSLHMQQATYMLSATMTLYIIHVSIEYVLQYVVIVDREDQVGNNIFAGMMYVIYLRKGEGISACQIIRAIWLGMRNHLKHIVWTSGDPYIHI